MSSVIHTGPSLMTDQVGRSQIQVTPDSVVGYVADLAGGHPEMATYVRDSWEQIERWSGSLAAMTFLLDENNLPSQWLGALASGSSSKVTW